MNNLFFSAAVVATISADLKLPVDIFATNVNYTYDVEMQSYGQHE